MSQDSTVKASPLAKILLFTVAFLVLVGGGVFAYVSFFSGADGAAVPSGVAAGKLSTTDSRPTLAPPRDRDESRGTDPDSTRAQRDETGRFVGEEVTVNDAVPTSGVEASPPGRVISKEVAPSQRDSTSSARGSNSAVELGLASGTKSDDPVIQIASGSDKEQTEVVTKTSPPTESDLAEVIVARQDPRRSVEPQSQLKELPPAASKSDDSESKLLVVEPGGNTVRLPEDKAVKRARSVYDGPREGVLLWRGSVAKNGEIIIQGNQVNSGSLSGELPGVPCILTLSDPRVAIAEAPGPSNGFSKITLRFPRKRSNMVLTINWQVLN